MIHNRRKTHWQERELPNMGRWLMNGLNSTMSFQIPPCEPRQLLQDVLQVHTLVLDCWFQMVYSLVFVEEMPMGGIK